MQEIKELDSKEVGFRKASLVVEVIIGEVASSLAVVWLHTFHHMLI